MKSRKAFTEYAKRKKRDSKKEQGYSAFCLLSTLWSQGLWHSVSLSLIGIPILSSCWSSFAEWVSWAWDIWHRGSPSHRDWREKQKVCEHCGFTGLQVVQQENTSNCGETCHSLVVNGIDFAFNRNRQVARVILKFVCRAHIWVQETTTTTASQTMLSRRSQVFADLMTFSRKTETSPWKLVTMLYRSVFSELHQFPKEVCSKTTVVNVTTPWFPFAAEQCQPWTWSIRNQVLRGRLEFRTQDRARQIQPSGAISRKIRTQNICLFLVSESETDGKFHAEILTTCQQEAHFLRVHFCVNYRKNLRVSRALFNQVLTSKVGVRLTGNDGLFFHSHTFWHV